ncbi:TetR/AcrR family transcriptional regulator [Nocardia sp. MDA0666]|uniref:TetR/AcrR family transcriptional regulator n=1 Tax=Nocardia sp. MDA0666 TaxID=2135448 RepID=UPI000D117228|nr:TetR/AcrR family transcriptional regulator [Nocardia sp. MDA0666]PSR59802.1 TetR/AcrR family transcriptional regulator [Nocardia sp. MDA0666]
MSQQNVRVVRTRTLLRQALIEAIEERGFDRITVGELTTRAMVSRAAFYRNYRDKYELVEQIFDEAMAEMTAGDPDAERTPEQRWAGFFAHIDRYHRLYAALLGRKGSPWFADRMRTTLAAMSSTHLPGQSATAFVPGIVAAMFVQSIVWWLDNGRPCPPEQMAAESAQLIRAVLGTASGGDGR